MADLDTRSKRASSVQLLLPWMLAPVLPDGTIALADRQHTAWSYSGIAAGSGVTPTYATLAIPWTLAPRSLAWSLDSRSLAWSLAARSLGWSLETRSLAWSLMTRSLNWTLPTGAPVPAQFTEVTSTETDYTAFTLKRQDVSWADGSVGHIDSVVVSNEMKYRTMSRLDTTADTCIISVLEPDLTYTTIVPDYYVDSVAGDDGAAGTAPSTALKTIGALPGLSSGDVVALKSGSTFAETFTPVAGVSVYRYGQGAKPIIDAGVTFTAGSWALTGGRSNAYDQAVTIELGTNSFVTLLEDGSMMSRVADAATCESTAGSFAVSTDTGSGDTSVTVYMHPGDSSDPTSNGKVCKYSRRAQAINGLGIATVTLDGIHTKQQTDNNGSIILGKTATVRHSLAEFGNKHNILTADGADYSGVVASDNEFTSNPSMVVFNESTPTGAGVTFRHCATVRPTKHASVTVVGWSGHNNVSGSFGQVAYNTCASVLTQTAFAGTESDLITITNPYLDNCNALVSVTDTPVTSSGGSMVGGSVSRVASVSSGAVDVTVDGLDLSGADLVGCLAFYSTGATSFTITDCNFNFNSETGQSRIVYLTNAGASFTATGNTYPDGWNTIYFASAVPVANITSDTNAFADDAEDIRVEGVTYNSVAAYQTATGLDANSTIG